MLNSIIFEAILKLKVMKNRKIIKTSFKYSLILTLFTGTGTGTGKKIQKQVKTDRTELR